MPETNATIRVDGTPIPAVEGQPVAAAMLAAGLCATRTTARRGEPRGPHCGIGLCFDCVATIDGRPNTRTCREPARDGLVVTTQRGDGSWPADARPQDEGPAGLSSPRDASPRRRPLVIVGGGPAGIACAIEAAKAGVRPTLVDEAPSLGGQIYRTSALRGAPAHGTVAARDAERGRALRAELEAVADRIEVLSNTVVVGAWGKTLLCVTGHGPAFEIEADRVVFATGARDRAVPFPGWTLPGVMTAGGVQTILKAGARPGRRALVAGTGPLLLVAATRLAEAGVEVVALLEAGRPSIATGLRLAAAGAFGLLRDAVAYRRALRRARIPLRVAHTVFAAEGSGRVERVTFGPVASDDGRPIRGQATSVEVDLLVVGFGLVPNGELLALAGCARRRAPELGGDVAERDARMRTSVPGVYAAGDGAGVAGALVAVDEGRVAGITAAEDAGSISASEAASRVRGPLRRLRSLSRSRRVLDDVFRLRPGLVDLATPETVVCRCEEVARAEVDTAIASGVRDLAALKFATRLGMGACQGRGCEGSATELLVRAGAARDACGRLDPRPPVRPVTLGALCGGRS